MKNLSKKIKFAKYLAMPCVVLTMLFSSCSKDKEAVPEGAGSYPKEVNIEYRVTSVKNITSGDVLYSNETGGNTIVDKVTLPYSVKVKRTVKQNDNLGFNFSTPGSGEVKVEILVNDKVVETKSFASTSYISGTVVYIFQ